MSRFTPCQGKRACRDDGNRCLTCGRDLQSITRLRDLMDQLATLAIDNDYQNLDDYSHYVARKLTKLVEHRRQQSDG